MNFWKIRGPKWSIAYYRCIPTEHTWCHVVPAFGYVDIRTSLEFTGLKFLNHSKSVLNGLLIPFHSQPPSWDPCCSSPWKKIIIQLFIARICCGRIALITNKHATKDFNGLLYPLTQCLSHIIWVKFSLELRLRNRFRVFRSRFFKKWTISFRIILSAHVTILAATNTQNNSDSHCPFSDLESTNSSKFSRKSSRNCIIGSQWSHFVNGS